MKAKEAAEWAKQNPTCDPGEIDEKIPPYPHALHRRAWLKSFKENLPPDLAERFRDLK
jgi:hypothetical protein